jgi:hypothetical protein
MKSAFKRGAIAPVVKASPPVSKAALLRSMLDVPKSAPVVDPKEEAQAAYQAKLQASTRAVLANLTRSGAIK